MSLIYQIALTLIKNVGYITARQLLTHFITAEGIFNATKKQLMEVPGIGGLTANYILSKEALSKARIQLNFIEKHQIKVLFYTDEDYPFRLKNCTDAPVLLYYKGNAHLNHSRIISVVGTRNATAYGRELCKQLAETLAPYDVIIVSGLAYGIDITAHQESLQHDIPTIGVLAHGLDRMYPQVHREVAGKMVKNGGLITEFPLYTNPDKENFPKRNRIIAGLADATIVVEAASKGGALITADIANSYYRDVYAFPGRTTDPSSAGCNFLIKTNRAALINHAEDLIYNLGWEMARPAVQSTQMKLPVGLSAEEESIVTALHLSALSIDQLALNLMMPQSKLVLHLLQLEMQGILISLPGKVYKLNQDILCSPL